MKFILVLALWAPATFSKELQPDFIDFSKGRIKNIRVCGYIDHYYNDFFETYEFRLSWQIPVKFGGKGVFDAHFFLKNISKSGVKSLRAAFRKAAHPIVSNDGSSLNMTDQKEVFGCVVGVFRLSDRPSAVHPQGYQSPWDLALVTANFEETNSENKPAFVKVSKIKVTDEHRAPYAGSFQVLKDIDEN